ncbi:MAG TPA: arginine--tRNA ligase [Phaeodactylibacter sp.]|nr:arginine--tRNA ligase [Phaeodactylibacter sp.]
MSITEIIKKGTAHAVKELYDHEVNPSNVNINVTRKEFDGDYSVVVFPYTKIARKKPEQIGEEIGQYLVAKNKDLTSFNVIKGFLNLEVSDDYWKQYLAEVAQKNSFKKPFHGEKIMIEFSSPNTNKPLHLGHIRNILLGWSCSKIYDALGYESIKVQIVNDRGIAICKSMLAWEKFGNGATPESTGIKGDHFVGKWYVEFETAFQAEYKLWQKTINGQFIFATQKKKGQTEEDFFKSFKNTYFNQYSQLGKEAKAMLLKWEDKDEAVRHLWNKMNGWVYEGFEVTYKNLGVEFDKLYFESDTYLLGKDMIDKGLADGVFYKKEDNSVWIDLESAKLDHKLVLRSDGTSVYMTQDMGTAAQRFEDFGAKKMGYVVADEQNYHFKVLFEIMKRMGVSYADGLFHLSYGMIDLTTGKMKSREGTIVDADDLMKEVIDAARANAVERGDLADLTEAEKEEIFRKIGLAALKFFIIKVNAQKRMVFDPEKSVDLQGDTGPYIQNAYVRIQSVLRKAGEVDVSIAKNYQSLQKTERDLVGQIYRLDDMVKLAADNFDPSFLASYCYDLAKNYHRFYHDCRIIKAESEEAKAFRIQLSEVVGKVIGFGMELLGIEMPERM